MAVHSRFVILSLLVSLLTVATAAAQQDDLLSDVRWQEDSYGLSLLEPADFRRLELPADDALVQFVSPTGTSFSIFIRRAKEELNLNTLKQQASAEITLGLGEALLIDDLVVEADGRPGSITYFPTQQREGGNRVFGLGLVKIDPFTVVVLHLEGGVESFEGDRAAFEAMVRSIEFANPADLDRVRTAWVKAGERWLSGVDHDSLQKAMIPEQWLRIVDTQGNDVGYARIRQRLDTMLGIEGIHIEVNSRIQAGPESYDTESFFFQGEDGSVELWSVRTAQRSDDKNQPRLRSNTRPSGPQVVSETGLRSGGRIKVKRQAPGEVDELEWPTPPNAYLSQVDLQLLPALLPRNRQNEFGFYAYSTSKGRITLRTIQIYPTDDGGYVVRERPSPERDEQISRYDERGRLIRREMADGMVMLPATAEEMRAIWDIR